MLAKRARTGHVAALFLGQVVRLWLHVFFCLERAHLPAVLVLVARGKNEGRKDLHGVIGVEGVINLIHIRY